MKCDVTLGKKFTFNTGNYSSTQPLLTITVKDVDSEDILKIHEQLDIVVDGLYHKQMDSDIKTMATVKQMGFEKYLQEINQEEITEAITKALRSIDATDSLRRF